MSTLSTLLLRATSARSRTSRSETHKSQNYTYPDPLQQTTEEVVDETIAGSENNDVAREVEKHNREVLAEALNIKKYNWQMDGILLRLDKKDNLNVIACINVTTGETVFASFK